MPRGRRQQSARWRLYQLDPLGDIEIVGWGCLPRFLCDTLEANRMADFFNQNLLQNIVGGVIVLFLGFLLSGGSSSSGSGKGGKTLVILATLMMLGGFLMFGQADPKSGMNGAYFGAGLSLLFFGYILRKIGQFFLWWHR